QNWFQLCGTDCLLWESSRLKGDYIFHGVALLTYGVADTVLPPSDAEAGKDLLTLGPAARVGSVGIEVGSNLLKSKLAKKGINYVDDVINKGKNVISNVEGKKSLSNAELVKKSATLAEKKIGGKGPVAGTEKHQYASKFLEKYQELYGDRGLRPNHSLNNGPGNRGILDVLDKSNGIIYDYKFGKARMDTEQYRKYTENFSEPIYIIRP
ncbi:hypothetical protein, partial [Leptospira meyeri]